MHYAEVYSQ
jgi:hypothetical protein